MHCEEVTDLRTFPCDTGYKAFWKTGQMKALHHVKCSNSTLYGIKKGDFEKSLYTRVDATAYNGVKTEPELGA